MKELELGIAERIMLIGVFNQVKGDIETLDAVLADVKEVSITEEEKKEINFQEVLGEDGKVASFKWDAAPVKAITLSEKTVKFVSKFIEDKSTAGELTLADSPLLEIKKKID